jgi:ribonuclease J
MIELTRPKCFVPVHGTIHHLTKHAELARGMGVPSIAVTENGRVAEVTSDRVMLGETIGAGRVHVWGGQPISPSVLKMREWMAEQGVAFCVITFGAGEPDILLETRGVMDDERGPADHEAAKREVREALANAPEIATDDERAEIARQAIRRSLKHSRMMRPVTIVKVRR